MLRAKLAVLSLAMISCFGAHAEKNSTCEPTVESSRGLVLSFYKKALIDKQPRAAFEQYVSADFVEHKPDIPGGTRAEAVNFLESLVKELPEAHWEVLRTVAEKDLVFLHARFSPASGAPPYAIADLFRLENCTIVEHWDAVGPPRDGQPNPNSRF